jgi:pyrimidine nucleoside transport protein
MLFLCATRIIFFIQGAVMAAYIQFGLSAVHMITASIMSAIGAIGACKIFLPDTEPSETRNMVHAVPDKKYFYLIFTKITLKLYRKEVNIFDLTTSSATTALEIFKSIITCLIIWLSAIPFVDSVVENGLYLLCGVKGVTFQVYIMNNFSQ